MARTAKIRPGNEDAASRGRIIAAAEVLFAQKGFYGAPLREIAREAAVNVNLVSYYFPEKEDLFNAVVQSRGGRLNEMRETLLDALEAEHGAKPVPVDAIVRAFIQPFFILRADDGTGWTNWARVVNREAGTEMWMRMILRLLGPVLRRYLVALQRAVPNAGQADTLFLLELMSMMMLFVKLDETAISPNTTNVEWTDERLQARIIQALSAAVLAFKHD